MSFSRRQFLRRGGFLAAGAVLPLNVFGASNNRAANDPASGALPAIPVKLGANPTFPQWTKDSFLNCIGSEFSVQQSANKKVWLKLLSVMDSPALTPVNPASMSVPPPKSLAAQQTESYVLHFHGALVPPLTQGTYLFEHAKMGQFQLLIVPGNSQNQTYVAVINRLATASALQPGPVPRLKDPARGTDAGSTTGADSSSGTNLSSGSSVNPRTNSGGGKFGVR